MRVAITRAQPEADATAQRLRDLGAEPVIAPLLRIEPRPFDPDVNNVQALLFTSANGVRAFTSVQSDRRARVLAVGEATARAARAAGFADVAHADGDGVALIAFARARLAPDKGRVLHISGAHVAADIAAALTLAGYDAERRIAYEAVAAEKLPQELEAPSDIILFHSARAAVVFVQLGAPHADRAIAACISPSVAEAASFSPESMRKIAVPWKRVIVAPRPREDDLLQSALASAGAGA